MSNNGKKWWIFLVGLKNFAPNSDNINVFINIIVLSIKRYITMVFKNLTVQL